MTHMSRNQADPPERGNSVASGTCWRGPRIAYCRAFPRLALLCAGLLLAVGSGSKGERAETGVCPPGETCSNETPSGLYFKGPSFADAWFNSDVHPTAVGGRQTITIDPVGWLTHLYDFDADFSTPAFTIASLAPPRVTVKAEAEGAAYLRILEPGTGLLYDRLSISALKVSHVTVDPYWSFLDPAQHAGVELHYGGTPATFITRIFSGSTRLIDEDVTFEPLAGASMDSSTGSIWDTASIQATEGATSLSVRARASDGTMGEGSLPLVWEIDEILSSESFPWPDTVIVGDSILACFYGELEGRAVSGVPFIFRVWNPEGIETPEAVLGVVVSCARIQVTQAGVWHLSVAGPGRTRLFQVTAVDQPQPPPPAPAPSAGPGDLPAMVRAFWPQRAARWPLSGPLLAGPGSPGCRAMTYLSAAREPDEPVLADQEAY